MSTTLGVATREATQLPTSEAPANFTSKTPRAAKSNGRERPMSKVLFMPMGNAPQAADAQGAASGDHQVGARWLHARQGNCP